MEKIECTPSKQLHVHIPHVCQTKNNLHKFFYWLHLVYNTDYHQPMRWLRAMPPVSRGRRANPVLTY